MPTAPAQRLATNARPLVGRLLAWFRALRRLHWQLPRCMNQGAQRALDAGLAPEPNPVTATSPYQEAAVFHGDDTDDVALAEFAAACNRPDGSGDHSMSRVQLSGKDDRFSAY
jgi:hypothetical protein